MIGRIGKVLALLALAVFAAAELGGRYGLKLKPGLPENRVAEAVAKFAEPDPVTGLRYRVNVDQLIDAPTGDFSILYKTNEIGLRDRPMGTHLRAEYKFLIFGDEFAEGWGTDIDQTFVVQAQARVNEKTALKPAVRFVIAGKSGYGAAQNYLAAGPLIESLAPKAIVFLYSSLMPHADARFLREAVSKDGLATGLKQGSRYFPLPHEEDYAPPPPPWLAALARQSVAFRMLAEWLAARAATAGLSPGDPASDRLAGMRPAAVADLAAVHADSLRHVKALADLAAARGIPFLLVHVPLPPQVAADAWAVGRRRFAVADGIQPEDDAAVVARFCEETQLRCLAVHRTLRVAAASLQTTKLFHPSELALTIDGANAVGRWFAEEILAWMKSLGWMT